MDIDGQLELWDMMGADRENLDVRVEGALNVKAPGGIVPFNVTLTTGDLVLIVSMIEDYIKGLDTIKETDILWRSYYRKKFKGISEKIQGQIDYDYEKAKAKCLKNASKEDRDDIGGEAISLLLKKKERERSGDE